MGSHRVGHDWSDLAAAAAINIYQIDRVNKLMPRNINKLNWQNCSEYSGSLFFVCMVKPKSNAVVLIGILRGSVRWHWVNH